MNSFYHSAERACYLQPAIDELLLQEEVEYQQYCARSRQINRLVKRPPPSILSNTLSNDDWAIITRYVEILKPLKDATLALEGHIGGRFGAIWRVLPQYKVVLQHFESLIKQYPVDDQIATAEDGSEQLQHLTAEQHFSLNVKIAWQKMDAYYTKLDNIPLYVAAVVLHPRMKWRWLEEQW